MALFQASPGGDAWPLRVIVTPAARPSTRRPPCRRGRPTTAHRGPRPPTPSDGRGPRAEASPDAHTRCRGPGAAGPLAGSKGRSPWEAQRAPPGGRVAAGDSDNSYLIHKLEGTATVGARMPQGGPFLDQATIDAIRTWIDQGALP